MSLSPSRIPRASVLSSDEDNTSGGKEGKNRVETWVAAHLNSPHVNDELCNPPVFLLCLFWKASKFGLFVMSCSLLGCGEVPGLEPGRFRT